MIFVPFLKLQKMDFGQKIFLEIDLFDFTRFFTKISWNQICKSISRKIFFDQIHFFCNFKNGQKSFFWTGKKFKTAKNVISRVFLAWTFLNFLSHCVTGCANSKCHILDSRHYTGTIEIRTTFQNTHPETWWYRRVL